MMQVQNAAEGKMYETADKFKQDATGVMDEEMVNASAMMRKTMDGFTAPEMPTLAMPKTPDMSMTLKTPEIPQLSQTEMAEAMKKKKAAFKCSDIPVFKIICGTYCLVLTIIALVILIWWIRVNRAAKALLGEVEDYDWEGAFDEALTGGTKAFDYPYGTLQK